MPAEFATKDDLEILRAELLGNKPPKFENDVGIIGKLESDIKLIGKGIDELSKSFRFMKGVPGTIVKVGGGLIALKAGWGIIHDLVGATLGAIGGK